MISIRSIRYLPLLVLSLLAVPCLAQPYRQPGVVEARIRESLRKADSLREAGRAAEAIRLLEGVRADRTVTDRDLRSPLFLGLARMYAVAGETDSAVSVLQQAVDLGNIGHSDVEHEPDFGSLRANPRFMSIVAELQGHQLPWARLWQGPDVTAGGADDLTENVRIAGLSRLWSEVRQNFAWFDRVPRLDWDSLYMAYLPLVRAARSPVEYYRQLQQMCALLRDGHTEVAYPDWLRDSLLFRPAIDIRALGDTVIVVGVHDAELVDRGIVPGLELVSVDGVPVNDYARRHVIPYQSGFSAQDIRARAYEYRLLSGSCSQPVVVGFRKPDGQSFSATLARNFSEDDLLWTRTAVESDTLVSNIGYLGISTFFDEYLTGFVQKSLLRLAGSDALVIDLRENGGGYTDVALQVLGLFMERSYLSHSWETPLYMPFARTEGGFLQWSRRVADQWAGTGMYRKPVVVLTSARTYSAAEHFLVSFHQAKRGVVFGQTSGGSSGHTLQVTLPAGGTLFINTTRDYFADGSRFNGVGVKPDVEIVPTVDDFRKGRDPVLVAAVGYLQKELGRSSSIPIVAGVTSRFISVPGWRIDARDGRRIGQFASDSGAGR